MQRRQFIAAALAGSASLASPAPAAGQGRQLLELRKYHLRSGSNKNLVGDFLRKVGIGALNRIGIGPVGVFTPVYGPNAPTLYVLLVHKSLESVITCGDRLMADKEFASSEFVQRPISDPGYVRLESSLLVNFKDMPEIAVPQKNSRIFEMRIYESHSTKAGKKKVEMFNEGGEIPIFKDAGTSPVFFAETVIGPAMPNLTYMLCFDDLAHRDKQWDVFRNHPDWAKLKVMPEYKDTVSNINDVILKPTGYSQI